MASTRELFIVIRARNNASRVLRRLARDLDEVSRNLGKNFEKVERATKNVDNNIKKVSETISNFKEPIDDATKATNKFGNDFVKNFTKAGARALSFHKILKFGIAGIIAYAIVVAAFLGPFLALVAAFGQAVTALALLTPAFLGVAGIIASVLIPGFQSLGLAMDLTEEIEKQEENIAKLTAVHGANSKTVQNAIERLNHLKVQYAELDTAITNVNDAIGNLIKAWQGLGIATAGPLFRGVPDEINAIAKHLDNFHGLLRNVAREVNSIALNIGETFRDVEFTQALQELIKDTATILRALGQIVKPIFNILSVLFRTSGVHLTRFIDMLVILIQKFSNWLDDMERTGQLDELFTLGLDALQAFFDLLGPLLRILLAFFKAGTAEGKPLIETLVEMAETWANFLESAEGQKFIQLVIKGAMLLSTILGILLALSAVSFFTFLAVLGIIVDLFRAIWNWASRAWGSAEEGAAQAARLTTAAFGTVKNAFAILTNFIKTRASAVANAFKNLGSNLYNIGRNLITSLINGIKSKASSLTNAIKSVANAIPSTFNRLWEMGSPSRVAEQIGRNFQLGLLRGFQKERNRIFDMIGESSRDIITGASGGRATTSQPDDDSPGSPINVTNNINAGRTDPRLIAAQIGFELDARLG